MTSIERLMSRRAALLRELTSTGDMRPGSISENYRRCGKENCVCVDAAHPGHGPYYAYTKKVAGVTRTVNLRAGPKLSKLEREVLEYKRFRRITERIIELSERICEARPVPSEQEEKPR
jgi:hypothetical protein